MEEFNQANVGLSGSKTDNGTTYVKYDRTWYKYHPKDHTHHDKGTQIQ